MQFRGRLRLPDDTQSGIPVELKLDDIYVVITSGEEVLGEWRMDDIGIQRLFSNQFLLDLSGEEMVFIADDPLGFAYEGVGHIDETSQRLSKRRRFKKKKARPEPGVAEVVDADRAEAARVKERRRSTFEPAPMPATEVEPAGLTAEPAATVSAPSAVEIPAEPAATVSAPSAVEIPAEPLRPEPPEPASERAPVFEQMFETPAAEVPAVEQESPAPPPAPAAQGTAPPLDPAAADDYEIEEVAPIATAAFLEPGTSPNGQPPPTAESVPEPALVPVLDESPPEAFEEELVIEEVHGFSTSATFESAVTPRPTLPVVEAAQVGPESIEEPVGEEAEAQPAGGAALAEPDELFPARPGEERRPEPAAARLQPQPEPEPLAPPAPVPVEPTDEAAGHGTRRERRLRRRREEETVHEHRYQEKAAVGGIIRRVCAECGHVSFGSRDIYEPWS